MIAVTASCETTGNGFSYLVLRNFRQYLKGIDRCHLALLSL